MERTGHHGPKHYFGSNTIIICVRVLVHRFRTLRAWSFDRLKTPNISPKDNKDPSFVGTDVPTYLPSHLPTYLPTHPHTHLPTY
jgi:hypothetical protein